MTYYYCDKADKVRSTDSIKKARLGTIEYLLKHPDKNEGYIATSSAPIQMDLMNLRMNRESYLYGVPTVIECIYDYDDEAPTKGCLFAMDKMITKKKWLKYAIKQDGSQGHELFGYRS